MIAVDRRGKRDDTREEERDERRESGWNGETNHAMKLHCY